MLDYIALALLIVIPALVVYRILLRMKNWVNYVMSDDGWRGRHSCPAPSECPG